MTQEDMAARLTALTMLVEGLWVEELAKEPDPEATARDIIDDHLQKEASLRARLGERDHALRVTETLTSMLDRAAWRAAALRASGCHG